MYVDYTYYTCDCRKLTQISQTIVVVRVLIKVKTLMKQSPVINDYLTNKFDLINEIVDYI